MPKNQYLSLVLSSFVFFSCSSGAIEDTTGDMPDENHQHEHIEDHHSYSNFHEVRTSHLHLNISADFDQQVVNGSVVHDIENVAGVEQMVFDVYDLEIRKVLLDGKTETTYQIGELDELMGAPLTVDISKETQTVEIFYSTKPTSQGLQWLSPQQTAGKKHPYLYSQGQAILTRSWIPCQDTPGNRITYSADVEVPAELMAVMSADNATEKSEDGKYSFKMDKPIPSYLIAIAVGDLQFKDIGGRTGLYTEPSMMDRCAYELEDVEDMVEAAEGLYGDYRWGRYDIIVLPPSFPFGGMENPKLTFATPTIIAGDKSLVTLVAHELAHSWSGNLVTNATWDDFWLNEGFTVYFEYRIMEELYGKDYVDMLMLIEYDNMMATVDAFHAGEHPEDTKLKLDLEGRSPDDGMTDIAYIKGAFFLKSLEEEVGRERFDDFINKYFDDHAFQTITTEMFVSYLNEELIKPNQIDFNVDEWIYEQGIPDNIVKVHSDKFAEVEKKCETITSINSAKELGISRSDWSTQEWIHFVRSIPEDADADDLEMLDTEFNFSDWGNSEIMAEWYIVSIRKGYDKINPFMEDFLVTVGRRKFLEPIYGELAKTEEGLELAKSIYEKARPNYHSISYFTIDEILDWES
jgi:leukotriene-A4 hydrolase